MPSGLHEAALRFSSAFRQLKHQPRAVTSAWCMHREPSLFPQTTFARVLGYALRLRGPACQAAALRLAI